MNLHIVNVPWLSIASLTELAASHISGCDRSLELFNLAVEGDDVGLLCKRCTAICGCTEHRSRIITDESGEKGVSTWSRSIFQFSRKLFSERGLLADNLPINYKEPPIPLEKLPLHGHVVLGATKGRECWEYSAWEVSAINLHPTTHISIPSSNIVPFIWIAVSGEICEDMRLRDLVWIIDP